MSVPPAAPEPRVIAGEEPAVEDELFSEFADLPFGGLAAEIIGGLCRSLGVPGSGAIR